MAPQERRVTLERQSEAQLSGNTGKNADPAKVAFLLHLCIVWMRQSIWIVYMDAF